MKGSGISCTNVTLFKSPMVLFGKCHYSLLSLTCHFGNKNIGKT